MPSGTRCAAVGGPDGAEVDTRTRRGWMARGMVLAAILAYGTGLRAWHLGASPLWTDEAESSINALTILQHGIPVDQYLGLPIFENTFTQPWPENAEYEFRDTSYSKRGVAIYHGWLPLYAIAASLAVHGVKPDEPRQEPAVRHSVEEMYRRTVAARIPSVVFAVVFLLTIYLAGREFYGDDAGWAALATATVSTTTVTLARQARYYSLTLAATALCALMLWRMVKRGGWRDFGLGGLMFVLLFHTNVLAFAGVVATLAAAVPLQLRHDRIGSKLALVAGTLAVGILPWALTTGFLTSASDHPMARSLLTLKQVTEYTADRLPFVLLAAATLMWLAAIRLFGARMAPRLIRPFASSRAAFVFLAGWASLGFLAFVLLTPAASFFYSRLTLIIFVPCLLFGAMLSAAIARVLVPRQSSALAAGLLLLLIYSGGKTTFWWPGTVPGQPQIFDVIEHLQALDLKPGTRLYADAGASLPLMYYSGLPFQNVMPVRRSFFDSYEGELLFVEGPRADLLSWPEVQKLAWHQEVTLTEAEARRTARHFNEHVVREQLRLRVARVSPPEQPIPHFFHSLAAYQRCKTELGVRDALGESGNPMFSTFEIDNYTTLWQVFFYRFVNPTARIGPDLNYASRIRHAEAFLLPAGWAMIRSAAP